MRNLFLSLLTVMVTLFAVSADITAATATEPLLAATTLPSEGTPEFTFYVKGSSNGYYWNGTTSPTQTDANRAEFAFYKATIAGNADATAYYIYNVTSSKWLSYTKAGSYNNKVGFVSLTDTRTDGAYFSVESVASSMAGVACYQIRPYNNTGVAGKYLNWLYGVGSGGNDVDGTTTIGLYSTAASGDAGSCWSLVTAFPAADAPAKKVNGLWVSPAPADGKFASTTVWYHVKNYQSGVAANIISTGSAYVESPYSLKLSNKTEDNSDAALWCIADNGDNTYKFYNKALGTTYVLSTANQNKAAMVEEASATSTTFTYEEGTNSAGVSGWFIKDGATGTNYWNQQSGFLGHWNNSSARTDNNSTFIFEIMSPEPAEPGEDVTEEADPDAGRYPFLASSTIAGAHWYHLTIRGNKYVTYDANNNNFPNVTTAPTTDAGLFAFVGTLADGFKIYNKAAGTAVALGGNVANNALISAVPVADAKLFLYQENSGHSVFAIKGADANAHVNDINGKLGYWTASASATDAGSTFTFEPIEILFSTEDDMHYYTIRNNNNPRNYAHYSADNQYLTLSSTLNNSAVFYFTKAGENANGSQLVNVHNYMAGSKTMNGWNVWGEGNARTWYVKLADGTTGQANDYNIGYTEDYSQSWNHQTNYIKSWSAGNDRGSGWYLEEVQKRTYDIRVEGADNDDYTLYNQGQAYRNGSQITGFFFDASNFTTDVAGQHPFDGVLYTDGNTLVFTFKEYNTILGGIRPGGVDEMTLWYDKPATSTSVADPWMDYGLPIGNGQIGAVLLGDLMNDRIQFNEKSLWEGGPTIGGNWGQGYYRNFGHIEVRDLSHNFSVSDNSRPVKNYTRHLDITNAVAGVNYESDDTHFSRTFLVSAPDKIMVGRYKAEGNQKLSMQFSYAPDSEINAGTVNYTDGVASFSGQLSTVGYNTRFRVVNVGGTQTSDANGITVSDASEIVLYMSAATNFDLHAATFTTGTVSDVEATNLKRINDAIAKGWDNIYADHVKDFSEKTGRVNLDICGATSTLDTKTLVDNYAIEANRTGDDALFLEKLYYQYGRYLAISSNNIHTSGVPSNLQGIWNHRSNGFWHCDLHADVNVQMCYWPMEAANLSEMHEPFLDHIIEMARDNRNYRNVARRFDANARGWMISTENNIFGGISTWCTNDIKTLNAWNCSHLWQHYLYTQDRDFLKRALPAMVGAAQFLMDISIEDSDDHTFYVSDEYSPEHGPSGHSTAFAQQNTTELMSEIMKAADILGNDLPDGVTAADIEEIRNFYPTLDKGLRTEEYQGKTCLSEWKDLTLNSQGDAYSHRHLSHLMALYPYSQVSPYADTDMFQATVNSLAVRDANNVTGWAMGWKVNLYARALDANKAHSFVSMALKHSDAYDIQMSGKGGCYYNLWDSHSPFQIDGNFGVTAGVNEMLLQSYNGTVTLLPALPDVWHSGSISGLKAEGNFEVTMSWMEGKLHCATIQSRKGSTLRLRSTAAMDLSRAHIYKNGVEVGLALQPDGSLVVPTSEGDILNISLSEISIGSIANLIRKMNSGDRTITLQTIHQTANHLLRK